MEIQCPWCGEEVRLHQDVCPECKHEVLPEHLNGKAEDVASTAVSGEAADGAQEESENAGWPVEEEYSCSKCGHDECRVNEVSMTGGGLSKLLDIQHHHYLFVSCLNCGSVDIYDPNVLEGRKSGQFGTAMDLFL